jgi:hypothetical protein
MTEFLACTKSPPAGVPAELGVGLCVMPRNHDGPCEYDWMGGRGRIEIGRGPSPMQMIEDLERSLRAARRMRIISTVMACTNLALIIYWIGRITS